MKQKLWSLGIGGAVGVVTLLGLLFADAIVMVHEGRGPARPCELAAHIAPTRTDRVLLVVLDAMSADALADTSGMPHLTALSRRGATGVARIESLMPSTVAGIEALVTGRSPPPLSIFEDFGTSGAPSGGLFAAVRAAGKRSYVVGPHLYVDLYGKWIDGHNTVKTVGSDDGLLTNAAVNALRTRGDALTVVHLGACDAASHRHGGASPGYKSCLRGYDAQLGILLAAAPAQTFVVVTSDHGTSPVGGHVGPEESVLRTPLVAAGPGVRGGTTLHDTVQTCLAGLVLAPLGLALAPSNAGAEKVPTSSTPAWLAITVLALALLLAAHSVSLGGVRSRDAALLLGGGFVALAVAKSDAYGAAGWVTFATLLVLAGTTAMRRDLAEVRAETDGKPPPSAAPHPGFAVLVLAVIASIAVGAWRLADALAPTGTGSSEAERAATIAAGLPAYGAFAATLAFWCWLHRRRALRNLFVVGRAMRARWRYGIACLFVVGLGTALSGVTTGGLLGALVVVGVLAGSFAPRTARGALALGAGMAALAAALPRFLGENVSLSTTDIRMAYELVDGALGLGGASVAYALRMMLPPFALLLGFAPWLPRARPHLRLAFGLGAALFCVAHVLPAALLVADPGAPFTWASLSVSALLRAAGELVFFFIAALVALALGHRRRRGRVNVLVAAG